MIKRGGNKYTRNDVDGDDNDEDDNDNFVENINDDYYSGKQLQHCILLEIINK